MCGDKTETGQGGGRLIITTRSSSPLIVKTETGPNMRPETPIERQGSQIVVVTKGTNAGSRTAWEKKASSKKNRGVEKGGGVTRLDRRGDRK